jgi:phosphinothricin acetyltransferase
MPTDTARAAATAALLRIRPTEAGDIAEIQRIYAHHVLTAAASFELEPPGEEEMARRWRAIVEAGYPHLVAASADRVVGYAYASAYRPRPAYRSTVEDSVYVRSGDAQRGIGGRLLGALITACEKRGFRQMVAVIGDNMTASVALHRRFGFREVGVLRAVGYKFGRWVDTALMQRALGAGDDAPPG